MKSKKKPTMRQLLKPIVAEAKERDLTLEELYWRLKHAWGNPTEREIKEEAKAEAHFQSLVSQGFVRDRH